MLELPPCALARWTEVSRDETEICSIFVADIQEPLFRGEMETFSLF